VEKMMRVLVVEDEEYLADAVAAGLRQEAMAVDVVLNGDDALEHLAVNDYDVVVLDRDIPGTHGDDVCAWVVVEKSECRVLMLTAARGLNQKVAGFELGADDYLAKPFEFPELVMRLRALVRRPARALPPVLRSEGVELDPFRREVYRERRLVRLSRKEFAVLELLMRADGGVVSAETLLEKAWDVNADPFTNAVRITISSLRKRLGEPWVIHTDPGSGYRFGAPR
jgi:two-component system response regulator VanR